MWKKLGLALGCAGLLTGATTPPALAATCSSSAVNSTSYADTIGDADAGLAPDIASGAIAIDASCGVTATYAVTNRSYGMLSGDFVSWYLDTDNNAATGSQSGFKGADLAIGRLGN